jgi:hypothetical protein
VSQAALEFANQSRHEDQGQDFILHIVAL